MPTTTLFTRSEDCTLQALTSGSSITKVKKQYLLVRYLLHIHFFTLLLLLYFSEVKKFKVILLKWAVSRLVRMCLAQPGYGSGLLPPV